MSKDISKIHYEILDKKRLELLDKLSVLGGNFILSGGTALALQIKHRQSFDFDFFSEKEISPNLLARLKEVIQISTVLLNNSDELTVMDQNSIKISFIYYPFKPVLPLTNIINGLKMFSIEEIAAQKAYTIGRRGAYRDYFDIYTLLIGNYLTLKEIIKTAEKIYGKIFNPKLFFEQLVYFKDLTNFEVVPANHNQKLSSDTEVREFLEKAVQNYLKN